MGDAFLVLLFNGDAGYRNERSIIIILSLETVSTEEKRLGKRGLR